MENAISSEERSLLESLIGEEVEIEGSCIAQDEYGIAHHCPTRYLKGVLRKVAYDPLRLQVIGVDVENQGRIEPACLYLQDTDYVWDIHKTIFHDGKLVFEATSNKTTPRIKNH